MGPPSRRLRAGQSGPRRKSENGNRLKQGLARDMARNKRGFSVARATQALQENVSRAGPVAGASYTLIGAIVLLGGLGYALDQWQGWSPWGTMGGLALGLIVGFYELIKVVWPR